MVLNLWLIDDIITVKRDIERRSNMKKVLSFIMLLAMALSALPCMANEPGEPMYTYEDVDNGIIITGYLGQNSIVEFPSEIDGKPVVGLGEYVITHESGVSDRIVQEVTIPEGVTEIKAFTFNLCEGLKKVTLPSTIKKIESSAFLSCVGLNQINLPEGLEVIEQNAFYGCESLKELNIPQSADITRGICTGCGSLERINVHPDNKNYSSDHQGIVYNKEGNQIIEVPKGIKGAVYIPEGVTEVPEDAFCDCDNMTAVVFPKSMELLGHMSFGYCSNLKTVVFSNPNTVILGAKVNVGMQLGPNRVKYPAFVETYPKTVYGYEGGSVYEEFKDSTFSTFVPFEVYEETVSTASGWAEPYILENEAMGVVTNDLSEDWTRAITREEFCGALIKALAYYLDYDIDAFFEYVRNAEITDNSIAFTDCDNEFVLLAAGMKIVDGKGEGKFAPSDSITREEAAVMLTRSRKICLDVYIRDYSDKLFDDDFDISEWAKNAVRHMKETGVMQGVDEKSFDPKGTYTCEQAMATFTRLFDDSLAKDGKKTYQKTDLHYDTRATYDRVFDYYDRSQVIKAKKVLETEYGTIAEIYTAGVMHGFANELEYVMRDGKTIYLTKDAPQYSPFSPMRWESLDRSVDGKTLTITYPTMEDDKIYYESEESEGRVFYEKGTYKITVNLETGEFSGVNIPL